MKAKICQSSFLAAHNLGNSFMKLPEQKRENASPRKIRHQRARRPYTSNHKLRRPEGGGSANIFHRASSFMIGIRSKNKIHHDIASRQFVHRDYAFFVRYHQVPHHTTPHHTPRKGPLIGHQPPSLGAVFPRLQGNRIRLDVRC